MNFADFKPTVESPFDLSGNCLRARFVKDHSTGDILCYHAVYNTLEDCYTSRQVSCSRIKACYMRGELRTFFIYKGKRFYVAEFQTISH